MPNPTDPFERQLIRMMIGDNTRILMIYQDAIKTISAAASSLSFQGNPFSLAQYPRLNAMVKQLIGDVHAKVYSEVVRSINAGWGLSNEKNDLIVDRRIADKTPSPAGAAILYDPNISALNQFITRKENGLDLSSRIWNSLDPFPAELTQGLALGISSGQSAASMAQDMQQYLLNPDKLFRRVRDEEGNLQISKAAADYHPGQGVYRSSFQNALRLTSTETNIAYRTSDFTRWQTLPFVTGQMVQTSDNHPQYDICDQLAGEYPKDFVFQGWHPRCICYATPMQMSDDEYDKYEDSILNGTAQNVQSENTVDDVPSSFTDFLDDNKDRIANWSSTPYWIKNNPQYTSGVSR